MKYFLAALLLLPACTRLDPHSEVAHNRKIMAIQEKFDRFDYNADSKLTITEVRRGIAESDVEGVTEIEIKAFFKHFDVNNDGYVTRWETQHAINSPLPETPHR